MIDVKIMSIKEIVKQHLVTNGFDGLAGDECGCAIGDLMPCDNPMDCIPGVRIVCKREDCESLNCRCNGFDGHNWRIAVGYNLGEAERVNKWKKQE